jgi:2-methylcitrate dehydratase PrpD
MAAALVDGELPLAAFTDEHVARPELQALLRKVHCREDEGKPASVEAPRYAEVTVRLRDGRHFQRRVSHPRGSAAAPMSTEEIEQKFRDCAAACLAPAQIASSVQMLRELDRLADLRELASALAGARQ